MSSLLHLTYGFKLAINTEFLKLWCLNLGAYLSFAHRNVTALEFCQASVLQLSHAKQPAEEFCVQVSHPTNYEGIVFACEKL